MAEIWKDIEGYEGLYQVSNRGRVKSLGNRSNHNKPIILKQVIIRGYKCVSLCKDSIQKIYKVHRLVAIAFIPNPKNKPQVNHIDGNKLNNNLSNLEWNTAQENLKHACRIGLKKPKKGIHNNRSKQIIQLDRETKKIVKIHSSLREIERELGYNHSNISRCCKGEYASAYGYEWRFANE